MLCDGRGGTCTATAHTHCVGLVAVPDGDWFCAPCAAAAAAAAAAPRAPFESAAAAGAAPLALRRRALRAAHERR